MTMEPTDPETVSITPSARRYLDALTSEGLLEGEPGERMVSGSVQDVLRALHHVLGGGTVSIEVRDAGSPSVVEGLDEALQDAVEGVNPRQPVQVLF